ncbi:MAG: hypothetical protein HC788_03600 [Sphingopyxis sp.]|nr:hypothetical protein [Sphingopyxis sp.]
MIDRLIFLALSSLASGSALASGFIDYTETREKLSSHQACVGRLHAQAASDLAAAEPRIFGEDGSVREVGVQQISNGVQVISPRAARYEARIWHSQGRPRVDHGTMEFQPRWEENKLQCVGKTLVHKPANGFTLSNIVPLGTYGLDSARMPALWKAKDVNAFVVRREDRNVVRIELTEEEQAKQRAGAGGNRPTMILFDEILQEGTIEVKVAAEINGRGGADARGFAGIVFHHDDASGAFEAVYLRMSNGTLNSPPPPSPRDVRAIQYVAHPDFHFDVSRAQFPGTYEKSAPVSVGTTHVLRIAIDSGAVQAWVDEQLVLRLDDLKFLGRSGRVGLWVGDGTTAYFSDLKISPTKSD